jgi:hypothetical protein
MISMKVKRKYREINCIDEDEFNTKVKSVSENDYTNTVRNTMRNARIYRLKSKP